MSLTTLRYTVSGLFGVSAALMGLPITDYRFYVLLLLFIIYGAVCNLLGKQEAKNGK